MRVWTAIPSMTGGGNLAARHGAFNIVSGLWPILSLKSFEAIFGPKKDRWLEYTVAGLLLTAGVSQVEGAKDTRQDGARTIGLGTASTLLAIDLLYAPRGRIRWTYLFDAAMEAGWIAAWLRAWPAPAGWE